MEGQGVPLVLPIDQEQVLKAVQKTGDDIKLANKLGVSTNRLKKDVLAELQRGLATELSYTDIARNISMRGSASMNRSMLIARTEGHRVQNEAKIDSLYKAKKKGANVVKQWCAVLDAKTRETHSYLHNQIRELDENFTSISGVSAPYPGGFGDPAEDCNCRCCLLQRARWAVKNETTHQEWNNETGGFIECSGYAGFKDKYLKAAEKLTNSEGSKLNIDITEGGKYEKLPYSDWFEYEKHISHEYNAQRMTYTDNKVLWDDDSGYIQNADGYSNINTYLRGINSSLDAKYQKTLEALKRRTENSALRQDYIGFRKVDCSFIDDVIGVNTKGLIKKSRQKTGFNGIRKVDIFKDKKSAQSIVNSLNSIVGTPQATITDKAVTSISMCEKINYFTHRPIQFEIQMPKGTKGLITNNYHESEFIAKANSSFEIVGAEVYNDENKDCIRIFAKLIQE